MLQAIDVTCVAACSCFLVLQTGPGATWPGHVVPAVAGSATVLAGLHALGLYRARRCARRGEELGRIAVASMAGGLAVALVQWADQQAVAHPLAFAILAAVALSAARVVFGRYLRAQRARGRHLWGVVIVGANEDAVDLVTTLRAEPELGFAVTGAIGQCAADPRWQDVPSCSAIDDVARLAEATGATGVMIVPYALTRDQMHRAIAVATAAGLHVQVWPGVWGVGSRRLRSVPVSGEPFFYVEPPLIARWKLVVKRAVDIVGAAGALVVVSPVLLLVALAIKLEDGGSVLYRGVRIGRHGKAFVAYKFRSMVEDGQLAMDMLAALNERTDGPLFKSSNDPRVTRVGRLLRSSSIDELPQLWNVLRGTMSLVGPRPALPDEVQHFDDELRRRHSVRPGLTGLWQVEARRNPSFHAYRRLDLRYVDEWSLSMDLAILASTLPSIAAHAIRELRSRRA